MDQDSNKNQTPSSSGPIPSGVGVMPASDNAAIPTTPPATTNPPATNEQPSTASGGLSMGFSMNPPTGGLQEPATPATTPTAPAMDMSASGSGMQIDNSEPPKMDSAIPPISTPPPADPGYTQTKSHKMMYIFIFLSIVIVVSLIVLFFYRQYMNITGQNDVAPTTAPQITRATSPSATPTVTPVNDEEGELQQIKIEEIDNELKDIETDVNQLNATPTPTPTTSTTQ